MISIQGGVKGSKKNIFLPGNPQTDMVCYLKSLYVGNHFITWYEEE